MTQDAKQFKIISVVGARPQIIKSAAISRAIEHNHQSSINEVMVHTGQHYDDNMSDVFFKEMNIPTPSYNLSVGSASHGKQTAKMLDGLEEVILKEKPDAVLVYGDTNSTVAGGLAASKLHIPLVHIEAGLRSFNKNMPEEINRILCDHMSTLLFTPTQEGLKNLQQEGFKNQKGQKADVDHPKLYHCGDIMYDNSLYFSKVDNQKNTILEKLNLSPEDYIFTTVHRDSNTDDPDRLRGVFKALMKIAEQKKIVLPLHARTKKCLKALEKNFLDQVENHNNIQLIDPVAYLDAVTLQQNSAMVITDSGGVQKEAFFYKKPCLILREQTEWVEIVENGNAIITNAEESQIVDAFHNMEARTDFTYPELFGDGHSAEFICQRIIEDLSF